MLGNPFLVLPSGPKVRETIKFSTKEISGSFAKGSESASELSNKSFFDSLSFVSCLGETLAGFLLMWRQRTLKGKKAAPTAAVNPG